MKNAWDKYHKRGEKKKASEYYAANPKALTEDAKNEFRNFSEKRKNKKWKYQKKGYHMNTDLN